ncbi:MAG: hypothetical protein GF308_22260 [Candidatus Heimdallarchaeota archaeon]|nr:hypothetical protein [Candidatus Heimdallarchaeota archaeon]
MFLHFFYEPPTYASATRRILQLLSTEDMSAPQIYSRLGEHAPKYRQSVNKALEILRECGLIQKYYSEEQKGLFYHLKKKNYLVKLDSMEVK